MFGAGYDVGTVAGEAGWTSRKLTTVLVVACAANALLLGILVADIGKRQELTIAQQKAPAVAVVATGR